MSTITLPIKCSTAKKICNRSQWAFILGWAASSLIIGVWLYVINKVDISLAASPNPVLNVSILWFFVVGWLICGCFIIMGVIIGCLEVLQRIPTIKCIKDEGE